jgi:uncharacterized protein YbaP (TraB family)
MIDCQQEGTGMSSRTRTCLIYFFASLVFLFFVISPAAAPDSEHSKGRKHFLWSVEGRKTTVYILGSIHILKKDSYPLPAAIERIYKCCKTIVFEVDPDGVNSPSAQNLLRRRGLYPAGQTLSKNISDTTYKLLEKKLLTSGVPIEEYQQFKPWFVALNLVSTELGRMGFDPNLGIERFFFNRAGQDNRKFIYLETFAYQINLFAGLSKRKQETLLMQMLQELDIIETEFQDLLDSWKTGDIETFESIIRNSFKDYPDVYDRLMTKRNKKWIPKIEKLLRQKESTLIIVGAGHLVGKDSVIDLMKKKGYKVKQL